MKSKLVLGGAGYIGSHLVRELVKRGENVIVVDNLITGHRQAVEPKARFCEGDIRDSAFLDRLFSENEIDIVFHFCAASLVGESVADPLKYYDNNVIGAIRLAQALVKHNVKKIIFSSTAAVYGEPQKNPIAVADITIPTNPYGDTKLTMEKLFRNCDIAHGLKFVALRYFNACGADVSGEIGEDHKPESHLIPLVLQIPLDQRESISVFGNDYSTPDGTCIRDYIHVTDLIDAHIKAGEYLNSANGSNIFNLGTGRGFSVLEIISAARKVTGHSIPIKIAQRRAGDPTQLVADCGNSREILNWEPKITSPEDIIASAWKWHKNHPHGYSSVR